MQFGGGGKQKFLLTSKFGKNSSPLSDEEWLINCLLIDGFSYEYSTQLLYQMFGRIHYECTQTDLRCERLCGNRSYSISQSCNYILAIHTNIWLLSLNVFYRHDISTSSCHWISYYNYRNDKPILSYNVCVCVSEEWVFVWKTFHSQRYRKRMSACILSSAQNRCVYPNFF